MTCASKLLHSCSAERLNPVHFTSVVLESIVPLHRSLQEVTEGVSQ